MNATVRPSGLSRAFRRERLLVRVASGAVVLGFGALAHADGAPVAPSAPPSVPLGGPLFRVAPDAPPPPAVPAPPPAVTVRLNYSRGPGAELCPDEQGFREAVAANVGRDPFTPAAPRLATVTIQRQGSAFVAFMEMRNAAGAREWMHEPLSRNDCRELVRLMGLSIAIPIDPFPAHPRPPAVAVVPVPALPPAQPPPSPPAAAADRRAPPPASRPAERPRIRLGLRAGVELGTAPVATAGFGVQVGVRWRLVSLSVEGRADLPSSGAGNAAPMALVHAAFFAGSLVPCGHIPLSGDWNIPICALVTLGAIHGGGLSVDVQKSGTGFYAAAGGRAGLEIPVNDTGSIALRVDGELLGAIKPVTITLSGHDAWTTGRVAGGAGGGVRFDF